MRISTLRHRSGPAKPSVVICPRFVMFSSGYSYTMRISTSPEHRAAVDGGPWLFSPDRPTAVRTSSLFLPEAVLFDRDGTLVEDIPYNGDPELLRPMPGARAAVAAARSFGLAVGVVSNQSGVARGLLSREHVEAVRRRVDSMFGLFDVWAVCPHGPADGCGCRKPAPGLVLAACERLGADPVRTVVIGDIGSDMAAAAAAGARGVLVPTPVTLRAEVRGAAETAPDLLAAVSAVLPTGARAGGAR